MILSKNYNKNKLEELWIYYNEYEWQAFRPLTFSERKVNWVGLKGTMKRLGTELQNELSKFLPKLAQWNWTQSDFKKMVEIVSNIQKESFEYWKQTASSEMKVKTKLTNEKVLNIMQEQNKVIIWKMMYDINQKLKQFSEEWIVKQFLWWLNTLYLSGAINLGRESVYEANKELVYWLQYSAILDWRTTNICRGLDWMIVKADSSQAARYQPPNHWNCRSIRVEILQDEVYKPKMTVSVPDIDLKWKTDFNKYLKVLWTKIIDQWIVKDQIKKELDLLSNE